VDRNKKKFSADFPMKTIIYYFTGTGNSLAAAKSICTHLGDCDLVSIASLSGTSSEIQPGADRVGIVFAHNNRHLDAAFVVRMVGNFVPLYDPAKRAKREKLLADADTRLGEIAGSIDKGLIVRPDIALLSAFLKRFTYDGFIRQIHDADKKFIADGKCTTCGAGPVQQSAR
jgi:hypothetical protein